MSSTKLKIRGIISLTLLMAMLIMLTSGIILMLYQQEIIDNISLLWRMTHVITGFLLSLIVIIHLFLNYKLLFNEIKKMVGRF